MSYLPPSGSAGDASPERLVVLIDAALELASEHELNAVLARTVARAAEVAGADYAAIGVYDDDGRITTFLHEGIDADAVSAIGDYPHGYGLLGEVIAAAGPVRINDIGADRRSVGFPPNHPPMRTFLGVPVRSAGRSHGNLYVTNKRGGNEFDHTDETLIGALATFAGCAIDNSLLLQAERVRREAEAQLVTAKQASALRQEVLAEVIRAQESERVRVARDLHDQIGQSLTSVLLVLRLMENAPPDSAESALRAQELRELVTDALDEVHQLAYDLRPSVLDDIGLVAAIERLAETSHARLGLTVTVECDVLDDRERLPRNIETAIYRIVQEALTNVARHAGVDVALIELTLRGDTVVVAVHDNGCGFDPELTTGSLGLIGMEERAALVGGTIVVDSLPGAGTTVRLVLPSG